MIIRIIFKVTCVILNLHIFNSINHVNHKALNTHIFKTNEMQKAVTLNHNIEEYVDSSE